MQLLSTVGPESCPPATTPSGNSQGRSGEASGFGSFLEIARGSSGHKVTDQGSGDKPDSQSSPVDAREQAEADNGNVEALAVALAAMGAPAMATNKGDVAIEASNGTDYSSESATAIQAIGHGVARPTTTAFQVGVNQQAAGSPPSSIGATPDHFEIMQDSDGSIDSSQLAGVEKLSVTTEKPLLSSAEVVSSDKASANPDGDYPVNMSGKASGSRSADPAGYPGNLAAKSGTGAQAADTAIATGKTGKEVSAEQLMTESAASATERMVLARGASNPGVATGSGIPAQQTGTFDEMVIQEGAGSGKPDATGATMQNNSSATKAIAGEGQGADNISVGAATGATTGRGVSEVTASRETAGALLSSKGDLLDQILEHAATLSVPRNTSMRVQLRPPELGWLDLRLGMKDGILTLQITTESAITRGLIEMALPQLRQALQARDIQVGDLTLGLNSGSGNPGGWLGNGTSAFEPHGQWAGQWRRNSSTIHQTVDNPEIVNVVAERAENGLSRHLVDYRV